MAGAIRTIRLTLSAAEIRRGVKSVNNSLTSIDKTTKKVQRSVNALTIAYGSLFAVGIVTGFVDSAIAMATAAEEMDILDKKLRQLTGDTEALFTVMESADSIGVEFTDLGRIVGRFAIATDKAFSTETMTEWAEGLVLAARSVGASQQEMNSAMLQLSQALGSGVLQGEEFRAVNESMVPLMTEIADVLGIARSELKAYSSEGKITTEIMTQALEQLNTTMEGFEGLTSTMAAELARVSNQWKVFLDNLVGSESFVKDLVKSFGDLLKIVNKNWEVISAFFRGVRLGFQSVTLVILRGAVEIGAAWDRLVSNMTYVWDLMIQKALSVFGGFAESIGRKFRDLGDAFGMEDTAAMGRSLIKVARDIDDIQSNAEIDFLKQRTKDTNEYNASLKALDDTMVKFTQEALFPEILTSDTTVGAGGATGSGKPKVLPTPTPAELTALEKYAESLKAIQAEIDLLPDKVAVLTELWMDGAIATDVYNRELEKLTGTMKESEEVVEEWGEAMKTALAGTLVDSIGQMTDAIVDFAITAEGSFREMTASMLSDISKLILKLTVMNALKSIAGGPGGALEFLFNEHGNAFQGGNVIPFKSGGVVSSPTVFPMAQGVGLMGEAGPEAILPLSRDAKGDLGVKGGGTVVVNMNINGVSDAESFARNQSQLTNKLQQKLAFSNRNL